MAPDMPHRTGAPAPPPDDYLAQLAEAFTDPGYLARTGPLGMLNLCARTRDAIRGYERVLVQAGRGAGIPDRQLADMLGIPRQNLHRQHGKRAATSGAAH
jgi:hypothetical protein